MKLGLSHSELLEKIKEAIANGADVNDDSRNGHRPLQLAINAGCTQAALLLIKHGADINYEDASGEDPIHAAINNGEFEVADVLIDREVDFDWHTPDLSYDYTQWYRFVVGW